MCDPVYFHDEIERDASVLRCDIAELEFLRPIDYSDMPCVPFASRLAVKQLEFAAILYAAEQYCCALAVRCLHAEVCKTELYRISRPAQLTRVMLAATGRQLDLVYPCVIGLLWSANTRRDSHLHIWLGSDTSVLNKQRGHQR